MLVLLYTESSLACHPMMRRTVAETGCIYRPKQTRQCLAAFYSKSQDPIELLNQPAQALGGGSTAIPFGEVHEGCGLGGYVRRGLGPSHPMSL